jgi:hypothetical protein
MKFSSKDASLHREIVEGLSEAFRKMTGHTTPVNFPDMSNQQIYDVFYTLGAHDQLLAIVGSIGDTLEDHMVVEFLEDYNRQVALGISGKMPGTFEIVDEADLRAFGISDQELDELLEEGFQLLNNSEEGSSSRD